MISGPVTPRTREGLWGQILSRPDLLEQGLQIIAQDLDLHEVCTVDGVGRDAAGRAVLLFAVVGSDSVGLPVKVLEAHSFLQRNGSVLSRVLPESGIYFRDAWRVAVVAMGLPDACVKQISALGLDRVEIYEVESFALAGEGHLVVRPVLGYRTGGGEDGFHVPSGLLDPARRSLCAGLLASLHRMDPRMQVYGDRFSRRLTTGTGRLLDLRIDGDRILIELGSDRFELSNEEDCAEVVDLALRRYLDLLTARVGGESSASGSRRAAPEPSVIAAAADEGGLSLEPLRRTVAETRISREEYTALGGPFSSESAHEESSTESGWSST